MGAILKELHNSASKFQFPSMPKDDVDVKRETAYQEYNILGKGKMSYPSGMGTQIIKWSGYFWGAGRKKLASVNQKWIAPKTCASKLKSWQTKKTPLNLVVSEAGINEDVTIKSFEYKEARVLINPMKYKYLVAIMTADKKAYDITQFVEDVSWEEGENQLAARISFSAKNDKTSKGRISSLAKPGCYAALLYSYNGGKNAEATRGKIVEWNPSARTSGEKFKVKAYDVLYDLQESQDHVYFSAGVKTKSAIVQVLKRWGIKVTSYSGPNVKHGKLAYKSEKLGTVVVKILKEAKKKGGIEACLRAVKMNVTVVGFGTNKTVYHFEETQHLTEVNHKISTTGMVTRVKIIGKANDDGCSPVEATVDGKTSYGIRQKIVSRGTNDTLDEAKKEAREILADDGKPKEEITIKLPDIPIIRKGDKIHLKTASISAGYYIVISATHDVDKMLMTLGLKKAPAAKKSSGNKKTKAKSYDVGDIVNFHGGKHYVSSYPDARGYSVGAGKAKITIKGGSGKAHPWHLVTQNWNQTHVWGWVDDGSFD